jgi:BirA family biotin operon repressor/biotin-[acetyl-CoA-carboxylase] ligase
VNVIWLDEVESTNDVASRLMLSWLETEDTRLADTVVVAGRQTAGRGRGSRLWESPAGGLYASWLGWLEASKLATLPLAVAVGLAEAIEVVTDAVPVRLKWPNDLIVNGRKLGGILCESRGGVDGVWAIAGFGVNLTVKPELGPGAALEPIALASLATVGDAGEVGLQIVSGLAGRLRTLLDTPATTVARWRKRSVHRIGDRLKLRSAGADIEAMFVGIADDGQLELDVAGVRRRFAAGELMGFGAGGEDATRS